jgi:membrane protease YdiL (CAAX protease family)
MPLLPDATDRKDPANITLMRSALGLAIVGTLLVIFVQQFLISLSSHRLSTAPAAMVASEEVEPLGISELTIEGKDALAHAFEVRREFNRVSPYAEQYMKSLDEIAITRTERFRVIIISAVLISPQEALARLDKLDKEGPLGPELRADADALRKKLQPGPPVTLEPAIEQSLIQRHGFFGLVAAKLDLPDQSHVDALLQRTDKLSARMLLYYLAGIVAFIAGLTWLIGSMIKLVRGELTGSFDAPAIGGPVYLEVYAIFTIGLMVALLFGIPARTFGDDGGAAWFVISELAMWTLVGVGTWPLLRKVPRDAWALDMGLHTGEGIFKEALIGVAAFCVGLPLTVGLRIIIAIFTSSAEAPEPGGFPMFKPPVSASWGIELLQVMGAVVWAPIVEECVFRGALYRFLSGKVRWWLAVLISSAAFGFMHPYSLAGLLDVALAGVVFGLLREWRGSLVAPIVCHIVHNGFLSLGQLIVLAGLGE